MILKSIVCLFKGHDINPEESIVPSMNDNRTWLCKCHRCGLYEMHDGAILNSSVTVREKTAMKIKRDFELKQEKINKIIEVMDRNYKILAELRRKA